MAENIAAYEHRQREEHRQRLLREGQDIDELFPLPSQDAPPKLDELAEFVERLESQAEAQYQDMLKLAQAGVSIRAIPVGITCRHPVRKATSSSAICCSRRRAGIPMRSAKNSWGKRACAAQMYLMSAQAQSPALRLSGDLAQIIRQRVTAAMLRDKDLSGLDLTGADLSGMDLCQANLRGALLENANLRQTQLVGCDLREAMLARADLSGAVLQQADLSHASLALAKCEATDFGGAQLHETNIQQTLFQRCDFTMASLRDLLGYETLLGQCDFSRATLANITLMELQLEQLTFSHARLEKSASSNAACRR